MINIQEKQNKILSFIEENGPSLPIQIAKTIEMDAVFASAITSELISSKKIKTSHMKVGASSLYFLPGQEQKLEEYTDELKSVEKGAFLKLKENKLIIDEKEEPATRVALRNIKDFAIPFRFQEKIMWKYAFAPDEEIEKLLSSPKEISKPEPKTDNREKEKLEVPKAWKIKKDLSDNLKPSKQQEIIHTKKESGKIENIFTSPEIEKPEPEFLTETKNFLKQKNIEFIEEIRTEKKEIVAIVSITSQLGNINFLLIAKNKKTITKDEVKAAIQMAIRNNMPCLLIIRKQPAKSLQKIIDENHLIKIKIMK